ncbi:MAG: glycoside hydrolase family 5 protein, partial [Anaerolineae bacterium]|nr:glycoside hydrolase family 5 protein [Anaerolineae bacterium]
MPRYSVLILAVIIGLLAGCAAPTSAPSPTPPAETPTAAPSVTPRPTATPTATPAPPDAELVVRAARLGRGVNLGNALEGPTEGEWGMVIEEAFFSLIREAGFDTVRVPIRWSAHAEEAAPYTVDPEFFVRIDWVIEHALAQDLNVVVNMHHYDELFESPADHGDRFVSIWEQIAARYEPQPDTVYFELLNEPHGNLDVKAWNLLLERTVGVVRAVDDHHTLVLAGADWGGISSLQTLVIPEGESNVIATFHYYDPFLFTHQGAEWADPEIGTVGVTWPGPPEAEVTLLPESRKVDWVRLWFMRYNQNSGSASPASPVAITQAFDRALDWSESTGIPLWLGEFGAYSTADIDSRARWTATVRTEAEAHGFSWAY